MRYRSGLLAVGAAMMLPVTPALAHGQGGQMGGNVSVRQVSPGHWGGPFGNWYGGWQPTYIVEGSAPPPQQQAYEQGYDRDGWLRECRRRLGDSGVGGAVLGGVVGGVAGNVIAGHGDKLLGTVAGAAVGAIAGAAIDRAEDAPRNRDRCEAMLEGGQGYAGGYGNPGYGYAPMMVPVMMVPVPGQAARAPCTETTVTEEYYEPAPRRSRHIPPRAPVRDKRVKIVPDKRIAQ